ncbi:MAG: sulfatase [Cytophagales bacterium]|nr:MAG: sulfatase [Cytophagales bacterium]
MNTLTRQSFFSTLLVALLLSTSLQAQSPQNQANRPNIIYILADDLGYADLICYRQPGGGQALVKTPNLDRMAAQGTRFTRFYAGSTVCAPSRAALMTGMHAGHGYIRGNGEIPLRKQDTTLVQRLKAIGYRTGMFGKWGLGVNGTDGTPDQKGFDEFFGYLHHVHAHKYHTDHLWQVQDGQLSKQPIDTTAYTHDLIMNRALDFVRNSVHKKGQSGQEKPFFMYLPVTLVHAELATTPADLKPFLTADGQSRLLPETPFAQRPNPHYQSQDKPHAAFAAMLGRLDSDVGRLLALLRELGIDQNTLVLFTSDNGPHKEGGADPEFFDSNGPLRGIKRDLYEGGIRVPMIARWPGRVPANRTDNTAWANWDILPTFCQLTGANQPQTIDGLSMTALLAGKQPLKTHDYFYWQFNEGVMKQALTQGDWKLIRLKEKDKREALELYNLKQDLGETNNIADKEPVRTNAMRQLMQKAVTPSQHPKFDYSAFN